MNPILQGAQSVHVQGTPTDLLGATGTITSLLNTSMLLIGILSVVMLVYGGYRYITSGGNEKNVTAAKNTVLYAVIGLIICLLASAIVKFIISVVVNGDSGAAGLI